MHTYNNILSSILLISVLALASCSGSSESGDADEPQQQCPIAFAFSEEPQQAVTRAATTLGQDFVVYGYKSVGGQTQTVFNGYNVIYLENSAHTSEDNTHNYYYVQGDQTIKYWDFSAAEYHFWGATNAVAKGQAGSTGKAEFTADGTSLSIPIQLAKEEPTETSKYTELYERKPVSADVVTLRFKRAYSKVCIKFYTSEPLDDAESISLTNITFAPDPGATSPLVNKIFTKGTLTVTYPQICTTNKESLSLALDGEAPQWSKLPYLDLTLSNGSGTASNNAVTALIPEEDIVFEMGDMPGDWLSRKRTRTTTTLDHYYLLPMGVSADGKKNPAFVMTANINGNPEPKTAVVPAVYMQWLPNIHYTYIFKITDGGREIQFYDVQIEPWRYGGEQEEEWKNW